MKTLKEVQADRPQPFKPISLNKLLKSKVVDIEGSISTEFGEPVFSIHRLVLEDGTVLFVEGEHDIAYVSTMGDTVAGLEDEQLNSLVKEQDGE